MKVSEAIEILKTLDQDKELITAMWEDGAYVFDKSFINDQTFKSDLIECGFNPDKIIVIS